MLTPIAYGLTILLAVAIIVIGLRFFFAPNASAAAYGFQFAAQRMPILRLKGSEISHMAF